MRLPLLVVSAALAALFPLTPPEPSSPGDEFHCDSRSREAARIDAHLQRVERELRNRDVSCLGRAKRAARMRNLRALHDYRVRGVFPHNHEHPGELVPSFIDAHGTRCAMAHLIEASGGGALVLRVAASANHARIGDLANDPELVAWLEYQGLTLEEAARIQPQYHQERTVSTVQNAAFGTLSALTILTGTLAVMMNVSSDLPHVRRRGLGAFAVGAGLAGVAVGGAGFGNHYNAAWSAADLAFGTASLACGLVTLNRHDPPPARDPRLSIAPYLRRNTEGEAQLAVNMRF